MNLQKRIDLFIALGKYLQQNSPDWQAAKLEASQKNPWFTEPFIDMATRNIIQHYLQEDQLRQWVAHYHLDDHIDPKNAGVVMAGNIPLVGFHDFLTVCISGHRQTIKLSAKDDVLLKHIIRILNNFDAAFEQIVSVAETLKGCDAYIATGGNQSARYFEQYFSKYPHIIRRNKTSVALLTGTETTSELEKLAGDIHFYFGLGCRNVTKIYVPTGYDFIPLLDSFRPFNYFRDHHKYANNYDYQLSIALLNNVFYMTNESTLLIENENLFSPISVLHYEYYSDIQKVTGKLTTNDDIQCIVGNSFIPFGQAQSPGLFSYADGVDTMAFLLSI